MSKDKYLNKRAYAVRGAATKRKRKQKAGGGKKAKPGHSYVTFCPECTVKEAIAVASDTKEMSCKQGHVWAVV